MKEKLNQGFVFFSIIVSIALLVLLIPDQSETLSSEVIILFSSITLVNILLFFRVVKKYFISWIRYDVFFIIGYIIVHFQIPLMESFGIELLEPDYVWINKKVVNYAAWLSSIALLLWMFGFLLYIKKINTTKLKKEVKNNHKNNISSIKSIHIDNLIIISLLVFISLVGKDFLSGSYNGTVNWGAGATYIFIVLQALIHLRVFIFFFNNQHLKSFRELMITLSSNLLFVGVLFFYILLFLLVGDRGPVMQVGIIVFGAYSIYINKISLKTLLIIVLVGSTVFTIIGMGRTRESRFANNKNIIERGLENAQARENSVNPTEELATSVRILYQGLDKVPDTHPYLMGITILFDLVAVVPFGASNFIDAIDLPLLYQSSPNFFTILSQGPFFTYGEGSEILADLYINFGLYGVLIVIFGFGYFIAYISVGAYTEKNRIKVLVFLVLLSTAIYVNRSCFLYPLRDVFYVLLMYWLLVKHVNLETKNNNLE